MKRSIGIKRGAAVAAATGALAFLLIGAPSASAQYQYPGMSTGGQVVTTGSQWPGHTSGGYVSTWPSAGRHTSHGQVNIVSPPARSGPVLLPRRP